MTVTYTDGTGHGYGRYVRRALAVATECLCVLGRIRECINSWVSGAHAVRTVSAELSTHSGKLVVAFATNDILSSWCLVKIATNDSLSSASLG